MTADEIKNCLREFAQYGCFQQTTHCRKRMRERSVSIDDALHVLLWGDISEIEYNKSHDCWQCKVTGADIDGDELVFIAGVYEYCRTVRCITVY